jgi:hypothetical protein
MRYINATAAICAVFCVVVIIIGTLGALCYVFRDQLDAFDRGEMPCCDTCCAGVMVLCVLVAIAENRRA